MQPVNDKSKQEICQKVLFVFSHFDEFSHKEKHAKKKLMGGEVGCEFISHRSCHTKLTW